MTSDLVMPRHLCRKAVIYILELRRPRVRRPWVEVAGFRARRAARSLQEHIAFLLRRPVGPQAAPAPELDCHTGPNGWTLPRTAPGIRGMSIK